MIKNWNNTVRDFPALNTKSTLHELFEEEVERSSEKIAVVYEDVQLTYRELNEKANRLAHYLRSICDIQPDDIIALFLDKSELMIVSILGVWKSGAAYVPIDPTYPDDRIEFIVQDTKAKIVIVNEKYITRLHSYDIIKIDIDSTSVNQTINTYSISFNPDLHLSEHSLAYVIYTSGTTGKPKGVLIEHASVVSFRNDIKNRYFPENATDTPHEAILILSNYVFDFSIEQLTLSILSSNKLIIVSKTFPFDENFYYYLNQNELTYLSGTPSQISQMDLRNLKHLRSLTLAGEPLSEMVFDKIRTEYAGKLINAYGITETTVYNMVYAYENDMKYKNSIGVPLLNTKAFVLNNSQQMLPVNAVGELYLTGSCVSRGYLNRPQLTAERFLPNPFQTNEEKKEGKNARIYKTGDLVRWLPDGELEYLGRNDLQVKIRGLRIELGEIEAVLSSYQGVNRSVVLAKDHKKKNIDAPSTKYLVGYYVSDDDIDESNIKQYIQTKLPDYMIPNRLMRIEKIPVTINGKLDAKALPEFNFSAEENNYCAPRNELEVKLCEIWSDILGIEKVGITDDFFRLGGDSIGSLQIVGRLRQDNDLNISVKDIFMFKTIEKLYENKLKDQVIHSNALVESLNGIELTSSTGEIGLLPIQEYLLKRKDVSSNHLNQRVVFRLARFDENKFKECLAKLVSHEEVFGLRFKKNSVGEYYQYYETNVDIEEINLVQMNTSPSTELNVQAELRGLLKKTTDIESGPMYMVGYSYDHEDNGSAKVWIFIHDLIADWTSCRIISEDLQRLYIGSYFDSNSCYKQWSHAVKGYVSGIGKSEMEYWQSLSNASVNIFNAALAAKQLSKYDISETEISLTEEITKGLLNDYNKIYNTQTEHLLLTALGYTMRDEITSLTENYVMFECSVRDFVNNLEMNRSIGMFRTIYPVRLQLDDDDVRSSITNIKEHVKQVPNKGIGFGAIPRNENDSLPWVLFNYLGLFENQSNENGNGEEWCLLDAFCENKMNENTNEVVKINSFIINKQMRLNIKTKMGTERTVQFGKAFQINIEKIIKHTILVNRTYLTRSDVHYVIKNNDYLNRIQLDKEVDAIFLANSLQQGLLYHSLKQSNVDDAYIVQSILQYRTHIDQKLFKMAWEHAQKRFSTLRLRFDWQEELIQIIDKKQSLDWRFIDLTTEEEDDVSNQESKIKQIQEEDRNERFQLNMGNLFRVYLIQQKSDLFVFIFSFHHIILDGWSLPILFDYVHQDYLNLIGGEHQPLPITSSHLSSYRDQSYENAQRYLQKHCQDNIDYWENEINKIEDICDLTGLLKQEKKNRVVLNQYDHVKEPKSWTLTIADNVYRDLKNICRENGLTLSSILQFVWHKILSVYGNSSQTVIGTTVSGRNLPIDNIETSVGLFINTLPFVVNHCADGLIIDAIKDIQDRMNEMITRSNVDFSQLSKGKMKRSLFDCLLVYENYPTLESKVQRNEELLKFETKYSVGKLDYPLAVVAYKAVANDCVTFVVNYAGELFEKETIVDLLGLANELFTQLGNGQVTRVSDLHLLPMKQLKMINEWNDIYTNVTELNTQTTLHKLFEAEAGKSSEKIAVIYQDVQLTYRELNEKGNQLAHHLGSICDIQPDDIIALFLDKSELMIVSILGVWKSGAAYVPIDPSYPDKRIQFILQDTKAKIVITNKKYVTRFDPYYIMKIAIDCLLVSQLINNNGMTLNSHPNTTEHNLAYVIYTSGTTGKPKGVLIEHGSAVSFKNDIKCRYFGIDDSHTTPQAVLFLSNYVFDFTIEQIALSILSSNTLIIPENTFTIDDKFYSYLNKNRLTYLSGTPTQMVHMNLRNLYYLQALTIGGEPITERAFEKLRREYSGKIRQVYGVTEATVYNTVYVYENDMKYKNSIGSLLSNTKRFVLNKSLQMLPVHAVGELYLGGNCVSRGYLNRPQLTAERFLLNPFQTDEEKKEGKNARIYKTGDLVRWLPDGELEYLGRNDLQVKIRGLRIELGEIEAVLSSYQGVNRSVVLAKDHKKKNIDAPSTKYLVGYYVSDDDIDESNIKQYIQTKLPDYMIPNRLMRIEKIPVTINGKLDTKALPEFNFSAEENNYCAPRNKLEANLCEIWSDLLGLEKVGITDDFFLIGGDSVSSVQLVGRIEKDMNLHVSIKDIFAFRTIDSFCQNVFRNSSGPEIAKLCDTHQYEQGVFSGEVPLLPIQEWFFMKFSVGINHWNQAFLIETPILDQDRLKDSLIKLMDYHDAFKLRFKRFGDKKYLQYYEDSTNIPCVLPFNHLDVRTLGQNENTDKLLHDILTKWQSQFDIENGPLFCVGYLNGFVEDKARVWFAMHHLIVDTVSWRIICEDLRRLYGGQSHLGKKGSSYRQWSQLVQSYAICKSATEGVYWRNLVSNICCFNDNLSQHNAVSASRLTTNATSITLSMVQTCSLLRDCPQAYGANINVLLLTALGYILKELTGNRINYVTLEGHGREDIDDENVDISRTVGWFTTMYPVLLEIDDDLMRSIMNIRAHLMQVPNKGIGYGTIIGYKYQDLPRVSFNYLGRFEAAPSTKASNSGQSRRWYLTDGIVGDELAEMACVDDVIAVNGLCMKGQIRFNLTSRLNSDRTVQLANSFKSKLEDIIRDCFAIKPLIEIDYSNDFEHPFVLLNANANNILFVLPPGVGGAESYFNNIVPHLSAYKLVLFNNYFDKLKVKHMEKGLSYETLARLYIKYIKLIQSNGPYNLLGWSFGGVLSFEISRQLNNGGDEIANLFMIDSCFNLEKAAAEIHGIREMGIVDEINYSYLPHIGNEAFGLNIVNMNVNIVLFKANKLDNDYRSNAELELLKYYTDSAFNYLDTIVNHKYIRVIEMHDESHTSWISNKEQIANICNYLVRVLK
ncbi:unnamed protein product [Rotaria socialis]|nr:unnamed protein product [Rotaria socialis]